MVITAVETLRWALVTRSISADTVITGGTAHANGNSLIVECTLGTVWYCTLSVTAKPLTVPALLTTLQTFSGRTTTRVYTVLFLTRHTPRTIIL